VEGEEVGHWTFRCGFDKTSRARAGQCSRFGRSGVGSVRDRDRLGGLVGSMRRCGAYTMRGVLRGRGWVGLGSGGERAGKSEVERASVGSVDPTRGARVPAVALGDQPGMHAARGETIRAVHIASEVPYVVFRKHIWILLDSALIHLQR
jgi:hypothetical protein